MIQPFKFLLEECVVVTVECGAQTEVPSGRCQHSYVASLWNIAHVCVGDMSLCILCMSRFSELWLDEGEAHCYCGVCMHECAYINVT